MVAKFDECRCSPINLMNLDFSRLYYRYVDECRCSPINLMNLDFSRLYYRYGFVDKLCTLINLKILIN
jgi:hypothetical protein